ncbi:MAG: hypothetical protein WAX69_21750 [Victivallales bacterium]
MIDSPLIAWIISTSCQASWQGVGNVQKSHYRHGTANMRMR